MPRSDAARSVATPWLRPRDWERWRRLLEDGNSLPLAHEAWVLRMDLTRRRLERDGVITRQIEIDPDAFLEWCSARMSAPRSDATWRYASELMSRRFAEPSPINADKPRRRRSRPWILVVEDSYYIADDLARTMEQFGARIVGPFASVDRALDIVVASDRIDGAVLDINLRDELVFPLADALSERRVPFVFATGYDQDVIPERYRDVTRYEKPFDPAMLAERLMSMARHA